MNSAGQTREISEETWDRKEHDWTGKAFFFVNVTFIFGNAVGLDTKLELLTREVKSNGYKIKSPMILIQQGKFKGRIMIEVEKKDLYDAQIQFYDTQTSCDTMVHLGGMTNLGKGIERLKERVASRRQMSPREIFYLYQSDPNASKTILFALT